MTEQRLDHQQSLQQQQTIAPQMQQSLRVLAAPTLELRHLIQQELESNPALEDESTDVSLEEATVPDEDDDFDREFEELSRLDEEWREYLSQSKAAAPRGDKDAEKHQFLLDSIIDPVTLQEHLLNQLAFSNASRDLAKICQMLIGNIDDNGFLQVDLEDLCFDLGIPIDQLEDALGIVQSFDPVGVGAQDLRDCLMIQLERLGKYHSLEYRIVENHLDELARHRYPEIAKKLTVTPEEITRAAKFIASLDPRPGSRFNDGDNNYVTPDVTVTKEEGAWVVNMNDEQLPRLRISSAYKDLLASGEGKEARNYIREKIKSGKYLIKSIHQRQQTMRQIAEQIVQRQAGFFEAGSSRLLPLTMAQIAGAIEVHETTVSRAVSGKYMATPHGVFEMKYFFTSGYQGRDGEALSSTSVKEALADVVAGEDSTKPLSDQALIKELEKKGIKIARRTVAKYRKELNILPSHLRRTY